MEKCCTFAEQKKTKLAFQNGGVACDLSCEK